MKNAKGGKRWSFLIAVYLIFIVRPVVVNALPKRNSFSGRRNVKVDYYLNPSDGDTSDEEEEDVPGNIHWTEKVASGSMSGATVLYGAALLRYPHCFPGQLHALTMMRSTGFHKIERGIHATRQNVRQAVLSAVRHAPSLFMMTKGLRDLDDRIAACRDVKCETKRAKADGVVTRKEQRKIDRMENRNIRALKRDIRRLRQGGSSLGRIIQVLDFDEILNLVKNFMFIMSAVLASGHSESIIGTIISRYCHFLNLGSLFLDINCKLGFPLSTLAFLGGLDIFHDDLEDDV